MNAVVKGYGSVLLRYEGVLYMAGEDRKVIFQGVHQQRSTTKTSQLFQEP